MTEESVSSELPPTENESPKPMSVIPDTGCSIVVDKYTDLLLTDKQKKEIEDKTNYYYSMKKNSLKKPGICVLCNKRFDSINKRGNQFINSYDESTYCRTLEIVCFASSPCKGWKLVYGVVFNLEELIREHRKQVEEIKRAIIVNKNDLMYGYKERKEAIELHEILIAQLEGIMDTYSTRLYKYLSYANNNRMNEDIDKINKHITLLTEDVKVFVSQDKIKEAVEASLSIKSDYICMKNLKSLQENSYREYLFNCESQFVEEEEVSKKESEKSSKEKEVIEKTQKKKNKQIEKEKTVEEKKESSKKKKIEQELNHLFMTFDIIDELLDADPDFLDQISKEIKKLKLMIKKNGTEEHEDEFKTIEDLFDTKFREVEEKKKEEEREEHSKIERLMKAGENDDDLKQQMEEEMEELS
jgi:hypothetical protein